MKYHNYIFDLYGTLVNIHTNEKKPYLWEKLTEFLAFYGAIYERQELKETYYSLCKEAACRMSETDYPEIPLEDVFAEIFQKKGITADSSAITAVMRLFRVLSTKFICVYDGVFDLLNAIKKEGGKIYLLSNAQSFFTRPELLSLGLLPYFDGIMISSEEGVKKPGSAFFIRLLEKYKLDKASSIMIGNDLYSDISGAAGIGLDTLYIHSNLSPKIDVSIKSTYSVMDGSIDKMKEILELGCKL